jgi:hypothetical protein
MIAPLLLHLLVNLTVGDRMSKDSWELLELISKLKMLKINKSGLLSIISKS